MAYFSVIEQHFDGCWWYHPRLTFDSKENAEEGFKKHFWWDLERPHKIIEHIEPFPQKYGWYSTDLEKWYENYTDNLLCLKCTIAE